MPEILKVKYETQWFTHTKVIKNWGSWEIKNGQLIVYEGKDATGSVMYTVTPYKLISVERIVK